MTTETFTPADPVAISGVGPYSIPYPFSSATEIIVQVRETSEDDPQTLSVSDYTITLAGDGQSGTVTLSVAAAASYDGWSLLRRRNTSIEQGWEGQSYREKGMEAQLDKVVRAVQDQDQRNSDITEAAAIAVADATAAANAAVTAAEDAVAEAEDWAGEAEDAYTAAFDAATSAAASADGVLSKSYGLFPSNFLQGGTFFAGEYTASPEDAVAPAAWSFPNDVTYGKIAQATADGVTKWLCPRGALKPVRGRTYRATVIAKKTGTVTGGTQCYLHLREVDADYTAVGTFAFITYNPTTTFEAYSVEYTCDRDDIAYLRCSSYIRNTATGGGTVEVLALIVEDVTGQVMAEAAASEAAGILDQAKPKFANISVLKAATTISIGDYVETRGYHPDEDLGGGLYEIVAPGTGTDDGGAFHDLTGIAAQARLVHHNTIDPFQWGAHVDDNTDEAFDCADIWNKAFWYAASIARNSAADNEHPIRFVCLHNIAVGKTLHASREPADEFSTGQSPEVEIYHPGRIRAIGGSTFESHLNAEMARLTTLHGSTVALGSALAAQFLKADPQLAVNLGDKIERPLPIINMSLQRSNVAFGRIDCDFWCSAVRLDGCTALKLMDGAEVYHFRKYGQFITKRANNAIKTFQWNIKQWAISDGDDHGGRMMPGGIFEPTGANLTGDPVVICQKDMIWDGGTYGWGRSAIVLLDKCSTDTSDRWAGRTMYPDYMTRWNDNMWTDHGGKVNQPEFDRMAPSTGSGDCNFFATHIMQGYGDNADEDTTFRKEGLAFGGQTGIECWNSTNAANFYGLDVDTGITQIFGPGIRFFGPTCSVGNTAKYACFHPVVRCYPARRTNARLFEMIDWRGSIGFFDFDAGDVGSPDVLSFGGAFEKWNYRNRVSSGDYTGPVQFRGIIDSSSGLTAAHNAVVAEGDFFHVQEAGTYGGQAMAKGDILYAKTLTPGTSYNTTGWHLGANNDVPALTEAREVAVRTSLNTLITQESDEPADWLTKPAGKVVRRMERGDGEYLDFAWDGDAFRAYMSTTPNKFFLGAVVAVGFDSDSGNFNVWAGGAHVWGFRSSSGRLRPEVDGTYEIGGPANRVKTVHVAPDTYADNASAVSGGLTVGTLYKTATGEVRVVV